MAVSNSTDFNLTAADLIEEARRKIGIHADEEPLQPHELVTGLRQMNMMLKTWQADGVKCWTLTEGQLTLTQGNVDYTFGTGGDFTIVPLEITSVRINRGSNDIPMFRLSREDYFDLPNKTTQGYPTQFYYDRQRSGGTLFVWPAPDVTAGTLKFTYRRIIFDLDSSSDDMDLPQEWLEAIMYGLAKKFGENAGLAGTPEFAEIKVEAARSYQIVKGFDVGEGLGSISITPAAYR